MLLFQLQRFCVHDGPGIRTTFFFKGCPLRCLWCHNPESQACAAQLLHDPEKCTACGHCGRLCPHGATPGGALERAACRACGACVDECLADARAVAGRTYSLTEALHLARRDELCYASSGGGVTLSGGEPLAQPEAALALARACRQAGLTVAVDTCGHVPFERLEAIAPYTQLFLYDLKHPEAAAHRRLTGVANDLILANLSRLAATGAAIALRLPLLAGVNDAPEHLAAWLPLFAAVRPQKVHLLPYHRTGATKALRLGRRPFPAAAPAPETLERWRQAITAAGHPAQIGG